MSQVTTGNPFLECVHLMACHRQRNACKRIVLVFLRPKFTRAVAKVLQDELPTIKMFENEKSNLQHFYCPKEFIKKQKKKKSKRTKEKSTESKSSKKEKRKKTSTT